MGGVDHFLKQIAKRAVDKKKEEAVAAAEEQAQQEQETEAEPLVTAMYKMTLEERMGPKGLDPVEVFESLPVEMQDCFKSGDVDMLKKVAVNMDAKVFENHFTRCI